MQDHPSTTKRGGVCVYYKNTLPFKLINVKFLQECITSETTNNEFEYFLKNFELTLDKIHKIQL